MASLAELSLCVSGTNSITRGLRWLGLKPPPSPIIGYVTDSSATSMSRTQSSSPSSRRTDVHLRVYLQPKRRSGTTHATVASPWTKHRTRQRARQGRPVTMYGSTGAGPSCLFALALPNSRASRLGYWAWPLGRLKLSLLSRMFDRRATSRPLWRE
ncbi:hypothetical protein LZ30DRAFT_731232 [Colletotrichum cereale]|nr:hypothetical protein LZ30DRAFT_731232 [Colletotrichum cereale]